MRILMVEDDHRLADLIVARLRREGHDAQACSDGVQGLELAASGRFDAAVVDVMLPRMDGMRLTAELRALGSRLPVLLLTARDTVQDRVAGLRGGADDYLVKPFAFDELLARLDAITRRAHAPAPESLLVFGSVALDPGARRVKADGREVELTAKEFDLLECLLRNAGRVVSRTQLQEEVWGFAFDARTKVVDLYVHYLRRKLGSRGDIIQTVRGIGYSVGR
ncbi:MAG TPA: response regulator transcription factor [Actinomycetota bacterium]|nr:response regulator transcription factor [Actinomycetota bacterium]